MTKFEINKNDSNQTIFKFIKKTYSTTPLSVIYKWFRKGDIKINSKKIKNQKIILNENDIVEIYDTNKPIVRDNFKYIDPKDLEIIYEDKNILIVNKAPDVEMHSEFNNSLDDLVKSYLFDQKVYDPLKENSFVISHVHRLDKLTSGLVIYAKNKVALDILLKAIQDKNAIEKYYIAQVSTKFKHDFIASGWIKYDSDQQLSIYSEDSKKEKQGFKTCQTEFKLLKKEKQYSLIEAKLLTGRKHQIRATLAYYQTPIINDFRYGGQKVNNQKMIYLSAYKLFFKNLSAPLDYLNGDIIELNLD